MNKFGAIALSALFSYSCTVSSETEKYLIIADMQTLDKFLHLFDRNTCQHIAGIVNRGQGPYEIAGTGLLSVDEP
ncbi:MAG: hypothetical protein LBP98_07960 [Tannerella sp.]|nr:hypothetical protein [Tannerella sp.]